MVTFREFKVGDLFETKSYRGGSQVLTGGNVPAHLLQAGDTPRISVSSKNNGIIGYYQDVEMASYRVFENAISVSFLGTVFYHPYRASYDMKVHCLRLQDHELRECEALYLISVLRKVVAFCSYGNQLSSTELVDIKMSLPVQVDVHGEALLDDDGNFIPDWDYMESYIHELEESYIHELEESYIHELDAYLKETGLDDYELTDAEQALLEREPMFREFKVGDLFDKLNLKRIKPTFDKRSDLSKVQTNEFDLPLVNAKAGNNGIMYYGRSDDWESDTMTIDIVNDGAISAGMVYAQPQATGTLYNAYQIKLKPDILSNVTVPHLLFLATTIQKSIQSKYSYSNKAVWAKVQDDIIQLPVKPGTDESSYTEDDIDWAYMESYIRAMEKQVIADVVDYKDSMITTAKELVYV